MIAYHLPYIGHSQIDLAALTLRIKQNYCIKSDHPTLAYIAERELGDEGYEVRFPLEKITRENLDQSIDAIIEEIAQHKSRNWLLAEEEPFIKHIAYSPLFKSESKEYAKGKGDDKITADENFEKMAFQVPEDLMEGIMKLQTAGYLSRLIEFLEVLQRSTRKLSRLRIASDFRIYLMDYDMMEVKMSPLPKAVYLLFLDIRKDPFKELPTSTEYGNLQEDHVSGESRQSQGEHHPGDRPVRQLDQREVLPDQHRISEGGVGRDCRKLLHHRVAG